MKGAVLDQDIRNFLNNYKNNIFSHNPNLDLEDDDKDTATKEEETDETWRQR